jgi:RNA polymerase sigma-70 factor (ECF subfamily)
VEEKVQSPGRRTAAAEPTPTGPELAALTRAMTKGEEMAWHTFYNAYFGRLWRYLLVVAAGNEELALEALQATLIRVARHLKVFADEAVFWSWLTVLARSSFADETKKRRRYLSFLERFALHTRVARDLPQPDPTEEQLGLLLRRQVALLPADERELIEQKYFAHRSVREIAADLQTTEKAVESRLSRIRQKLKDAALRELKHETET